MELDTNLNVSGDSLILKVSCRNPPRIKFNVQFENNIFFGVESMSIKAGQKVKLSINPVDAFGNPAKVDGVPAWSLSDDILAALEVHPSGLETVLTSLGPVGSVKVSVAADADLSDGVRSLIGEAIVDIEAGEAVDLGLQAEPIVIAMAPVEEPILVEEPVAVVEEAPVADATVVVEEAPVVADETVAVEEPVLVEEPVAVIEEAPVAVAVEEPVVAVDETAVDDTTVVVEEAPVVADETAIVDETVIVEEPVVAVDETAVVEEPVVAVEEAPVVTEEAAPVDETVLADQTVFVEDTTQQTV